MKLLIWEYKLPQLTLTNDGDTINSLILKQANGKSKRRKGCIQRNSAGNFITGTCNIVLFVYKQVNASLIGNGANQELILQSYRLCFGDFIGNAKK